VSLALLSAGGKGGVQLANGYYVLKTAGAPTSPLPTDPIWLTATFSAKLNDGSADDTSTEEAVSIAGLGTVGTIEILFVGAVSTWATERITLRYSVDGPTFGTKYLTAGAWAAWSSPATVPHLGDSSETYALNPTDQTFGYALFSGTCTGGGTATDWAVSDWRPST
jgi:hypothetical protein